jgi:aconitate hydratase
VFLRDLWPSAQEIDETIASSIDGDMFRRTYGDVFTGDERWRELDTPEGDRYTWPDSTYVRKPSFFEGMDDEPQPIEPIEGARVLAVLGDSVTTDHISPAGAIKKSSPAGEWLVENGVEPRDFNSYGSRRGNHEVMVRGTFANVRLRNKLVEKEGGFTRRFPDGEETTIYEAAMAYASDGVPLVVLAGKEYGSGSSRDWAAKGTALLGVRAVLAESFERIHRSNLIGMGVLPLQLPEGESAESLGLTGEETIDIGDIDGGEAKTVEVTVHSAAGPDAGGGEAEEADGTFAFEATVRLDTPNEVSYFLNGGILHKVLRDLR